MESTTATHLTYRIVTGTKDRAFKLLVHDLLEFGGKYDRVTKTWTIDTSDVILQMKLRHNAEYNATYPERRPTTPAEFLADRLGWQRVELVEA
jgi:hypothetical protein